MSIVADVLKKIDRQKKGDQAKSGESGSPDKKTTAQKQNKAHLAAAKVTLLTWRFRLLRGLKWLIILIILVAIVLIAYLVGRHFYQKYQAKQAVPVKKIVVQKNIVPKKSVIQPKVRVKPAQKQVIKKIVPRKTAQQRYESQLEKVNQLISQQHYQQAVSQLNALSRYKKQYQAGVITAAHQLVLKGAWYEAHRALLFARMTEPDNLAFRQIDARILLQQKRVKLALSVLQEDLPDIKSHPKYYELIASAYLQSKQYYLASTLYQHLLIVDFDNPNYWLGLALSYQMVGDNSHAYDAYNQALKYAPPGWSAAGFINKQLTKLSP